MAIEFGRMKHGEIRQAAELATRAFDDYEYFTNWFPAKQERNKIQFALIWHEYNLCFADLQPKPVFRSWLVQGIPVQ